MTIRASDASSWCHCPRRAWYDHRPPANFVPTTDRFETLISEAGQAHESRVRGRLGASTQARSAEHTQALIKKGAPIIYQPAFVDDQLGLEGRPDFLIHKSKGGYQVADAKLATRLDGHPEIRIQLALYRRLAGSRLPALAYLGTGDIAEVGPASDAEANRFLKDFRAALAKPTPPAANFSESKCNACPYDAFCRPAFEKAGELTLVYGVNARAATGLRNAGILTGAALARAKPETLPDVPYLKGAEKKRRAVLQAKSQLSGEVFSLMPAGFPSGTWLHFDVESNPLAETPGGEVYLWGLLPPPYSAKAYTRAWSDGGPKNDERAWKEFLALIEGYRHKLEDLRLVHYSAFEVTQLRTYAKRYAMEREPTVAWLLGKPSPLFDLATAVKRALVLPLSSYGLKAICRDPRLVNFQWQLSESGSQWSVVRYIDYLNARNATERAPIRNEIEIYNRDDVLATHALEMWVRKLAVTGAKAVPGVEARRPGP